MAKSWWIILLLLTSLPGSARGVCAGDCNGDGTVTVAEVIGGMRLLIHPVQEFQCEALDPNGNGSVTIGELIQAVNNVLYGCPESDRD